MFLKNDSRRQETSHNGNIREEHHQRGMRAMSFETIRSSFPLIPETRSQKYERVRNWVNNRKTGHKTLTQEENTKAITSTSEKINAISKPWDDCSLSTVSSASNSILNAESITKDDFGSTPTGTEQMKDDLDSEPRCEPQEETNAALERPDFYSFADYAHTKPYGRSDLGHQLGDSWEPKLSSGIERDVNDHDNFAQYERTKRYSGNHAFDSNFNDAHKPWEGVGRLDNVATPSRLSLKRKLHGDEAVSDAEKLLRRSHRFATDFKQPQAATRTADGFVGNQPTSINNPKRQASDAKKPCFSNRMKPSAQVPHQKPLNSDENKLGKRRPIVIDGSNVAMKYSNGAAIDCKGIQACVNHFLKEGHDEITVVVPEKHLLRNCKKVVNQDILFKLQRENRLLTCWSRQIGSRKYINCYDDKMILDFATKRGAIVISNDKYRDLFNDEPKWRDTIRNRVLPYRFVPGRPDELLLPQDPFGRFGPTLEEFLRF